MKANEYHTKFRICLRILLLISCMLIKPASIAQELEDLSIEDLFDVKVMELASGVEQQVNKAPAVVSVITAEEIKSFGALSVFEALEMVPGIHIVPSSFTNLWPVVTFRGIFSDNNSQVLWLLDGKRISYSFNGGLDINFNIPVGNIKKIEVIRGPASALYGAEAFSGVINLITYDRDDKGSVSINAGSFKQLGFSFRDNFSVSEFWELSVYAEFLRRDRDSSRIIDSDTQSLFDSIFGSSASLAPGGLEDNRHQKTVMLKLQNEHWQIAGKHFYIDTPSNAGVANTLNSSSNRKLDIFTTSIDYDSKDVFDHWRFQPVLNTFSVQNKSHFQIFPENTLLPIGSDGNVNFNNPISVVSFPDGFLGNPEANYEVYEFELPVYQAGVEGHQFRYSVGYRHEKVFSKETKNFGPGVIDGTQPIVDSSFLTDVTGTDFIFLEAKTRTVKYLSVQDVIKVSESIDATIGLRYDDHSDGDSVLTPRATIVWEGNDKLSAKFVYGRAFRTPSVSERGIKNNPTSIGNPNLNNETLDSFELSMSYILSKDLWINFNTYRYFADGLINYVPVQAQVETSSNLAQNVNELTGEGIETELFWQVLNNLTFDFNYAWQSTENELQGQQQPFVPKQQMFFRVNWQIDDSWHVSFSSKAIMDREREATDTRESIDDYWLSNLNIQYLSDDWRVNASVRNLFDEDIREPSSVATSINGDFPMNQRNGFVELSYQFW